LWRCAIGLPAAPEYDQEALSVAELCCRLDALLLAHRGVLVSLGLEHDELPMLLGEMDRVLLLGDAADAKWLAARLKATDPPAHCSSWLSSAPRRAQQCRHQWQGSGWYAPCARTPAATWPGSGAISPGPS